MKYGELHGSITMEAFGRLIGVSHPAVVGMIQRGVLQRGDTAEQWLLDYCRHVREVAAGRESGGDLNLAQERAALAREQRLVVALKRAREERRTASVDLLTWALSRVASQVAAILDAVPTKLKRRNPALTAEDIDIVRDELANARNEAAATTLDLADYDGNDSISDGDTSGDTARSVAA